MLVMYPNKETRGGGSDEQTSSPLLGQLVDDGHEASTGNIMKLDYKLVRGLGGLILQEDGLSSFDYWRDARICSQGKPIICRYSKGGSET